jgi:ABC-type antimicrobial peptide transport system permease subunit
MKQAIVSTVEALDPTLEAAELRTVGEVIEATTVRERLVSRLTSAFAVIALLLAAIGIYGTLSYAVARRTREIGVRMALGARVMDVVRLFLTEAGWMVGAGVVVGCAVALATTRLLASLLFGLSPTDPGTFAMAVLVLAGTAALAAWLPSRRAARVAPAVALRHE